MGRWYTGASSCSVLAGTSAEHLTVPSPENPQPAGAGDPTDHRRPDLPAPAHLEHPVERRQG